MKVNYAGTNGAFTPKQQQKIDARFRKLGKFVERRGEKGAHVVFSTTRHLSKAEVTLNYYDHPLVGVASDPDPFTALCEAIDKLEKQVQKQKLRWRDGKRAPKPEPAVRVTPEERESPAPRIVKVTVHQRRKPMTLDEALLEMGGASHFAFRDARNDKTAVLVRRSDGHIDLIES